MRHGHIAPLVHRGSSFQSSRSRFVANGVRVRVWCDSSSEHRTHTRLSRAEEHEAQRETHAIEDASKGHKDEHLLCACCLTSRVVRLAADGVCCVCVCARKDRAAHTGDTREPKEEKEKQSEHNANRQARIALTCVCVSLCLFCLFCVCFVCSCADAPLSLSEQQTHTLKQRRISARSVVRNETFVAQMSEGMMSDARTMRLMHISHMLRVSLACCRLLYSHHHQPSHSPLTLEGISGTKRNIRSTDE